MGSSLVIVESPAKARTINRYLGKGYTVKASMGHVRDLPKKELAVDVDNDFAPTYQLIDDKKKVVQELRRIAAKSDAIYIATDPDREGEAIGWHLVQLLEEKKAPKQVYRVLLEEITKPGIERAFANRQELDLDKVNAQQARRILDRLVGYKLSPLLWDKVRRGISAGRVQSVALRLVVDREREIEAFVTEEYWSITASLESDSPPPFDAKLHRKSGDEVKIGDENAAQAILGELQGAAWGVAKIDSKKRRRRPKPPFTTPQLQQAAYRRIGSSVRRTMMLAQQLYEGIDIGDEAPVGLITYMRTDSTRVADVAISEAREVIGKRFGAESVPNKPRVFKAGKAAQKAHEAIRPTSAARTPQAMKKYLDKDQYRMYELIWQRFVASQMADVLYDTTAVDIAAGDYTFRASGSILRFAGFLAAYADLEKKPDDDSEAASETDRLLPPLSEGDALKLLDIAPKQHFTQPPPCFSEATLVRELERNGIGRPSTYADILSKLRNRAYANVEDKRFHPSELGTTVTDLLVQNFGRILDINYTARVEERLDDIEAGKEGWVTALDRFWDRFTKELKTAEKEMRNVKREETPTEEVCDKCGKPMVIKFGRFGRFIACTGYPECKNTKKIAKGADGEDKDEDKPAPEPTGEKCPKCETGQLVRRTGRFGPFIGCGDFPKCRYIKPKTIGIKCPKCSNGDLSEKRTKKRRTFFGCTEYPDCDFATWRRPVPIACPTCKHPFLEIKKAKDLPDELVCPQEDCEYATEAAETIGVPE